MSSPKPDLSLLQRLRRPYFTTATQKKTKLKKNNITRQTALHDNIMLRSEYLSFGKGTLLKEQSRNKSIHSS